MLDYKVVHAYLAKLCMQIRHDKLLLLTWFDQCQ